MITEVFGKGTILAPNSPWNHGLKKQIGYGTCDERSRDTEEIQDVLD